MREHWERVFRQATQQVRAAHEATATWVQLHVEDRADAWEVAGISPAYLRWVRPLAEFLASLDVDGWQRHALAHSIARIAFNDPLEGLLSASPRSMDARRRSPRDTLSTSTSDGLVGWRIEFEENVNEPDPLLFPQIAHRNTPMPNLHRVADPMQVEPLPTFAWIVQASADCNLSSSLTLHRDEFYARYFQLGPRALEVVLYSIAAEITPLLVPGATQIVDVNEPNGLVAAANARRRLSGRLDTSFHAERP